MNDSVVVLSGGVGGAKLALGLYRVLPENDLTVVVNTGDDFDHYGLRICPDLDTTLYTLAGIANAEQGWGREGESWQCQEVMAALGGETWFQLGDRDLALHLLRTQWLREGGALSEFIGDVCRRLDIAAKVLPMSDQPVATELDTSAGRLAFQDYFVRRRCEPVVEALHYTAADRAQPGPDVLEALASARAIIIAPSNPYLSIEPILAVPGIAEAVTGSPAPVIAVTPVIGDSAVKGPTAKIMRELELTPSALTIAEHYRPLIDGFVLDSRDAMLSDKVPVPSRTVDTLMVSLDDRERVARDVLSFADALRHR